MEVSKAALLVAYLRRSAVWEKGGPCHVIQFSFHGESALMGVGQGGQVWAWPGAGWSLCQSN